MSKRWMSLAPIAFAIVWGCVPLFPSFITLTSVQFPGVSVVPLGVGVVVLALMLLLAVWVTLSLFFTRGERQPVARAIAVFLAFCMASALLGLNPRDGVIFVAILSLGGIWHYAQVRDAELPFVLRATYWSFLSTGLISCLLAIAMIVTRIPAAQYTIGHGRATGTFVLPGELAGYLIVLIALAVGLVQTAHSRALRMLAWGTIGIGVVTMLLTFSRTGFVGLACGAAFYVVMRARERKQGVIAAVGIVVAMIALVLLFFNERHNPSENYTRLAIWQAAIGAFQRFPLLGVGPFGFSHLYPYVKLPDGDETAFHAHSMYLTYLVEIGVVGLSAFFWVLVSFVRELRVRLASATPAAATLALAIVAGLVGTLVQGLIDMVSVITFGLLFPTLALALVAARDGSGDA
jgi:O-antigen ligase